MGQVIELEPYRTRRGRSPTAIRRLDHAVARLERLVRSPPDRLLTHVESELRWIADAVSAGRPEEAADRADRLADRLEHPAASG